MLLLVQKRGAHAPVRSYRYVVCSLVAWQVAGCRLMEIGRMMLLVVENFKEDRSTNQIKFRVEKTKDLVFLVFFRYERTYRYSSGRE